MEELESELNRLPKSTWRARRKWPAKYMLEVVGEVAALSYSRKGVGPKWTVVTSLLVSIYRDEVAKLRAIESFNLAQSVEPPSKEDKDVGDFD